MLQRIIRDWDSNGKDTASRLARARQYLTQGKAVPAEAAVALLEAVLRPGDKVNIEGDNQKQADFLAKCLCQVDLAKIHDLHMIQS
ncbi:MAG: malonate decarboxylase subunit alpha, partial [Acidaminococcaceae bacterium]|nr:malonate decarboxylase subunit alpha [Acidaminococcaceae bacterium]